MNSLVIFAFNNCLAHLNESKKFMKKSLILVLFVLFTGVFSVSAQETYKEVMPSSDKLTYTGKSFYPVKQFPTTFKEKNPKNIILLIGDGMGTAHIFAGLTANGGNLYMNNFRSIGFSKTQSSDEYITDSAAGGTALSTGKRTYNGAIGVDDDQNPLPTILAEAEEKQLSTGLVSTSAITHATPASFIAHQGSRGSYEAIAADFLKTDVDVFIGGGYKHFAVRQDGQDLIRELEAKGYVVLQDMNEIVKVTSGKLAGLTAPEHNDRLAKRGDMLPKATQTAINILKNNKQGFFLMVEGSMIDWGSHANDTQFTVEEVLDFDQAIGVALKFAAQNKETLVIVTADHETGGLNIIDGDFQTGKVTGKFVSTDHTGVMVPLFAYGPGAEHFTGIMDNTDVHKKMKQLLLK
jgi:alkaline phosphatase